MGSTDQEAMEIELKLKEEEAMDMDMEIDGDGVVSQTHTQTILPKMIMRVLLVEADDSTRRIIAALLRKCSYKVSAVSDGLEAWETLKGRPHNVDLILTEVDLPSISGYALLTLVMEHDICKNIPVIMMSSCDTVSMVLNCMLKGAADFLIKPIRKNELKNLWQHVWRRHTIGGKTTMHFAGGQHKVEATSDNDVSSNHSSDYVVSAKKIKECSERGSDSQSSCTTPYLEAESGCMPNMQGFSPLKDGAAPISNTDIMKHGFTAYVEDFGILESNVKAMSDNAAKNEACDSMSSIMKEDHDFAEIRNKNVVVRPESYRVNADSTREIDGYNNNESTEPSSVVIDLIGKFDDYQKCIERVSSDMDTSTIKSECSPQLELSLRRICPGKLKCQGNENQKMHALNHSNTSAFSSYNSCKMMKPPSLMLSNVPSKSETSVIDSTRPLSGNSGSTSQERPASNSQNNLSNKVDGEFNQPEHQLQQAPLGHIPVPDLPSDTTYAGHVFPSMFYTPSGFPGIMNTRSTCQQEQSPVSINASFLNCSDISNSTHGYHQHEEATNKATDRVAEELKHDSPSATHNSSSSLCNGTDHNNSDAYGSIYRQPSPVTVVKAGASENTNATNIFTHNSSSSLCNGTDHNNNDAYGSIYRQPSPVAVEKAGASKNTNATNIFTHEGYKGIDSHRSRQREAALEKFRLKRKDRCYEKKVRYQSRKRLAEQRPRVKGQFVRQQPSEPPISDAGCR